MVARVKELLAAGLAAAELAVIAPYSAQAALLRERAPAPSVEVDTVDAFQGREKDAMLRLPHPLQLRRASWASSPTCAG